MTIQRYNPPREVFVATDKGVKKMLMELASLEQSGGGVKLFVKGKLYQARSGTWTKHSRERRAIGDLTWSTRKEAEAVYKAYRARIVAAAARDLEHAQERLKRVQRG